MRLELIGLNTLAIIGAGGFAGSHFAATAADSGQYRLRLLFHSRPPVDLPQPHAAFSGDLLRPDSLDSLLIPGCTTVNFAFLRGGSRADNLTAIRHLATRCVEAGCSRLIHVSTADVAGRSLDRPVTEASLCRPRNDYERTKLDMELLLLDRYSDQLEISIVRPSAVFGQGGRNLEKFMQDRHRSNRWIHYIRSLLFHHRRMNLVSVRELSEFLLYLSGAGTTTNGEIYHVTADDSPYNTFGAVERLCNRISPVPKTASIVPPLPRFLLDIVLRAANKQPASRIYSNDKMLSSGYVRTVALEDELLRYFAESRERFT